MASKLPVVKVEDLTKKSAIRPWPHSNQSPRVQGGLGSNHSQILMAGNFAALWSTDPKFSALKDLNPFKTMSKVQEPKSISKSWAFDWNILAKQNKRAFKILNSR